MLPPGASHVPVTEAPAPPRADAGEGLLLAGDIGGTKTVLALVEGCGTVAAEATFPSREYATLETVV
ncbi:MAG TPA: hypothetical protein VF541_11555, partial [Longimicrobium sp.]